MHGLLRVESYTDPPENILDYAHWRLRGANGHFSMRPVAGRWQGPGLVVELEFADGGKLADRASAQGFLDAEIYVPRSELPELPEGQNYWVDLVGCEVTGAEGETLGTVERVIDTPAHAVLDVRGEKNYLIPLVRGPIVGAVDVEAGRIETSWLAVDES